MPAKKRFSALLTGLMLMSLPSFAIAGSDDPQDFIKDGKFYGEVRYRLENVDQDGFEQEARANTVRTSLGFRSGVYKDFQASGEVQITTGLGENDFNDTVNGNTGFPVVADPNNREINELWVAWTGLPQTQVKVGRQLISFDNRRHIGTSPWRQNDRSYDGVHIANTTIPNLHASYSYISNVNRVTGDDNPLGDLDGDIHLARGSYKVADLLTAIGYSYWLDFDRLAAFSSHTYGVRLTGETAINDDWRFFYEAEAANQRDHGSNTANYDVDYYHLAPGISGNGFTFKAGYELLGGDGTNSFQTPLGNRHKHNGWADTFIGATPGQGLQDVYLQASYTFSETDTALDGVRMTSAYHKFDGDESADFGAGLDLSLSKTFALPDAGQPFNAINVLLKYADYDAEDDPFLDTQKYWLVVGVKF